MSDAISDKHDPEPGVSLAEIFRRGSDLESFRNSVLALEGRFPFATADMVELGRAYLERFPDRDRDRNASEVRLGYAIVRTAICEKAILAVPPPRRKAYRAIFCDVDRIADKAESLAADAGRESVLADHDAMAAALAGLREAIENIPQGMIKERFIGGLSYFLNVLYAFRASLGRPRPE